MDLLFLIRQFRLYDGNFGIFIENELRGEQNRGNRDGPGDGGNFLVHKSRF